LLRTIYTKRQFVEREIVYKRVEKRKNVDRRKDYDNELWNE
jgi:hypothetical protein